MIPIPFERFPHELILRKLNNMYWEVIGPYKFYSTIIGRWVILPSAEDNGHGLWTDLTSVPWFLRWLISRDGEQVKPAIIHDFLYTSTSEVDYPEVDRRTADRIFLEAMKVRGTIGPLKMYAIYVAVRVGGALSYRRR